MHCLDSHHYRTSNLIHSGTRRKPSSVYGLILLCTTALTPPLEPVIPPSPCCCIEQCLAFVQFFTPGHVETDISSSIKMSTNVTSRIMDPYFNHTSVLWRIRRSIAAEDSTAIAGLSFRSTETVPGASAHCIAL